MIEADGRVPGTTHERPCVRFERDEKSALQPLPARCVPIRERRIRRRVATDCFVDVDTVRYSVPHRLVRRKLEVLVAEHEVTVYDGTVIVARHRRCFEPYTRVVDPAHFEGIYRQRDDAKTVASSVLSCSLEAYASCIGGDS